MPKFHRRDLEVDAFQLTPENIIKRIDWPAWLETATKVPRDQIGSLFLQQEGVYLNIKSGGYRASMRVLPSHWIVRYPDGELGAMAPDAFGALFDEAKATAK
jgi:hypothetical protein